MSGHSKWATIHRAKEVKDAARGALFSKLACAITIAAKTGGSADPEVNYKLRMTIEKARQSNMPRENVDRALAKASQAGNLEEVVYEGFGPSGIAVIVEAATDNRNRTAQEIKNLIEKSGGTMAGPGAVSYNFKTSGLIVIKKTSKPEEQMLNLIDLGVEDIEEEDETLDVYVEPHQVHIISKKLQESGVEVMEADITRRPLTFKTVGKEEAQKALGLLEALTDHEDVQKVYANLDVVE